VRNNRNKRANAADDEAWLFYCETGRPTEDIKGRLEFTEAGEYTLDASAWAVEEDMWTALLRQMYDPDFEIPPKATAQ
jgi:hypothetical protein